MMAWRASPLAVAGVIVAALSSASFRMVGPIYGQDVGLAPQQIGYFLAAFVAGGALAQYPMGWLADKYDRRWVLIWLSVAAIAPYTASALIAAYGPPAFFILMAAGHALLVVFGLSRMRVRETPLDRTPYIYAPRTSFTIGKLLGRSRNR